MSEEPFDYGDKKDDGQFERYPIKTEGELKNTLLRQYRHMECKGVTTLSEHIAETFAKYPKYYTHTFCSTCLNHFPVHQFDWITTEGRTTRFVVGDLE